MQQIKINPVKSDTNVYGDVATPEILVNSDGTLALVIRNWLYGSDYFYNEFVNKFPWIFGEQNFYGKTSKIPRGMFFLGDPHIKNYQYSKLKFDVQNWNNNDPTYSYVKDIRDEVERDPTMNRILGGAFIDPNIDFANTPILTYNSCLINYYRDGYDKIDYHPDREALGVCNAVVTVSLGTSRRFILRRNSDKFKIETVLNSGDLVMMAGNCQQDWQHSIPRVTTNKCATGRISLTYRMITN